MMIPLFILMIQDAEDRELLIEYYTQYRYTMLHVAQSILHDPGLAEDAVQEAFFRLAKNIKKVRPDPKQVRAFLVTIVQNVSIDIFKQRKAAAALSLDQLAAEAGDPADPVSVEETVIHKDEMDAAVQLLMSMPVKYSTVFLLRYKHDLDHRTIARMLNLPEATVRKHLQRARERITENMQDAQGMEVRYHA